MSQPKPRYTSSNPQPPPDRDTNGQTKTSAPETSKTRGKWPINVSEEPDTTQTTLDNGRSQRQPIISISPPPVSPSTRKSQKYVKDRLTPNQGLLHAHPGIMDSNSGICQLKWRTKFTKPDTGTSLKQPPLCVHHY